MKSIEFANGRAIMGEIANEHGHELGFASIGQNLDGDRLFGIEAHHFGYQGGQVSTQHI